MTLVGLEMTALPVIMPLIIGNSEEVSSHPQFPFMVSGWSCALSLRKEVTKDLDMKSGTDWKYRVVKR